jgi:hypothetical protein
MIKHLFAKTNHLGITNVNVPGFRLMAVTRFAGSTHFAVSILELTPPGFMLSPASRAGKSTQHPAMADYVASS